jgi:hypothetical protein
VQTIGLVAPAREPMTPITAELVEEARRLAPKLDDIATKEPRRRRA